VGGCLEEETFVSLGSPYETELAVTGGIEILAGGHRGLLPHPYLYVGTAFMCWNSRAKAWNTSIDLRARNVSE
jgi:hypothetical protein